MVDGLSKIVAVFIAVLLLFIYPLSHMADNQEESMKLLVLSATTNLVDSIRDKGYLDKDMFEAYLSELGTTGCAYEVEINHRHKSFYPIYTDVTDPSSFTGEYEAYYEGYFTEDITSEIDNKAIYYFSQDDFVTFQVYNTTKTFATQIKSFIFGENMDLHTIFVKYGGQIRYENY